MEKSIRLTVGSRQSQRPGRTGKLNGADVGRAAALAGNFQAVVFEPDLLGLVKGGPDGRRRFMDSAPDTKSRLIIPKKGRYPDYYVKCGHCGAEIGVIKTE